MSEETKRTDAPQPEEVETPAAETAAPETEAPAAEAEAARQALEAKLDAAEKKAAELKDQLLRTAAEYDNFRKRSAREQDASFNNGVGWASWTRWRWRPMPPPPTRTTKRA